jgi:hypothetical protein
MTTINKICVIGDSVSAYVVKGMLKSPVQGLIPVDTNPHGDDNHFTDADGKGMGVSSLYDWFHDVNLPTDDTREGLTPKRTKGMLWDFYVTGVTADYLLVLLGVNNVGIIGTTGTYGTVADCVTDYGNFLDTLIGVGESDYKVSYAPNKVIFVLIQPIVDTGNWASFVNSIKTVITGKGILCANVYQHFIDNSLNASDYCNNVDCVHPDKNPDGWWQIVKTVILKTVYLIG